MSCSLSPLTNIGMKQSMFISKHTHCLNNLFDLIESSTHKTITVQYPIKGVMNKISSFYRARLLELTFSYSSIHLITQLKNVFKLTLSTTIGMKL